MAEGLRHKLALLRKDHSRAAKRGTADHLFGEGEAGSRNCHDCQRYEWAKTNKVTPPCGPCDFYALYEQCSRDRQCELCIDAYIHLPAWRDATRAKHAGKRDEAESPRLICESLAKRIARMIGSRRRG